jgi:hypothetical protein
MKKENWVGVIILVLLFILLGVIFIIGKGGIVFMTYNNNNNNNNNYAITLEVCHNETITKYYNFHGDYIQVPCPNIPCYDNKDNIIVGAQCIDSYNTCWKFKDSFVDNYTYKLTHVQRPCEYGARCNFRIITRIDDPSYYLENTFPQIIKENYSEQVCKQQVVDEIILVHNLQLYSIQKSELTPEWIEMYCKRKLSEIKNFTKGVWDCEENTIWVGENYGIHWECFGEYKTGDIVYTKSELSQRIEGHKPTQFIYHEKEIPEEYKVYSNFYSCPNNYTIEVLE